jgi:redox-sensing transcriptional repressor
MYGIPCYNIEEASTVIKEYGIQIIILAVPPGVAQECIDIVLQDVGVKGILNFSPTSIIVPENVLVYNVDISVELEKLLFYLKQTMINI